MSPGRVFFVERGEFQLLVQHAQAEEHAGRGRRDDGEVGGADRHHAAEKQAGEITPGVRLLHERDARREHDRKHHADRAVFARAFA